MRNDLELLNIRLSNLKKSESDFVCYYKINLVFMLILMFGSAFIYQISYHISDSLISGQTFSKSYTIHSGIMLGLNYLFNILSVFVLTLIYKKTKVLDNTDVIDKHKEEFMAFIVVAIMLPLIFVMLSFIQGIYHMKGDTDISLLVFHQTENMPLLNIAYVIGVVFSFLGVFFTAKDYEKKLRPYSFVIDDIQSQIEHEKGHILFEKKIKEQNL